MMDNEIEKLFFFWKFYYSRIERLRPTTFGYFWKPKWSRVGKEIYKTDDRFVSDIPVTLAIL